MKEVDDVQRILAGTTGITETVLKKTKPLRAGPSNKKYSTMHSKSSFADNYNKFKKQLITQHVHVGSSQFGASMGESLQLEGGCSTHSNRSMLVTSSVDQIQRRASTGRIMQRQNSLAAASAMIPKPQQNLRSRFNQVRKNNSMVQIDYENRSEIAKGKSERIHIRKQPRKSSIAAQVTKIGRQQVKIVNQLPKRV